MSLGDVYLITRVSNIHQASSSALHSSFSSTSATIQTSSSTQLRKQRPRKLIVAAQEADLASRLSCNAQCKDYHLPAAFLARQMACDRLVSMLLAINHATTQESQ